MPGFSPEASLVTLFVCNPFALVTHSVTSQIQYTFTPMLLVIATHILQNLAESRSALLSIISLSQHRRTEQPVHSCFYNVLLPFGKLTKEGNLKIIEFSLESLKERMIFTVFTQEIFLDLINDESLCNLDHLDVHILVKVK